MLKDLLDNSEKYLLQGNGENELITEISFIRSIVRYQKKKIILFGGGLYAKYVIRFLRKEEVSVEFIMDNDENKEGKLLEGIKIYHPDRLPVLDAEYLVIISTIYFEEDRDKFLFALFKNNLMDYLYFFEKRQDIPNMWIWEWTDYYLENREKLIRIYDNLADEESKDTFEKYLSCIICSSTYKGIVHPTKFKYFECFEKKDDEVFLNLGSWIGDTIFNFLENYEKFEKIFAVEGDSQRFKLLQKNIDMLPMSLKSKIELVNQYLNEENSGIYKEATLINMDIEGFEKNVIEGLSNIIRNNRPVLSVCVYHLKTDLVEIPELIRSIADGYKIYFRKYPSYWNDILRKGELVLYAVPEERCVNGEHRR